MPVNGKTTEDSLLHMWTLHFHASLLARPCYTWLIAIFPFPFSTPFLPSAKQGLGVRAEQFWSLSTGRAGNTDENKRNCLEDVYCFLKNWIGMQLLDRRTMPFHIWAIHPGFLLCSALLCSSWYSGIERRKQLSSSVRVSSVKSKETRKSIRDTPT